MNNILKKLASGIAAGALAAIVAHAAPEITTYSGSSGTGFAASAFGTYNQGDLVLGFYSAGDLANQGDLAFNIGPVSSYTGLAPGVYSVDGFNGSSTIAGQPTLGFGSAELTNGNTVAAPSSSTFWTVAGYGASNTLYLTGVAAQSQALASTQSTVAGRIAGVGSNGANSANADGSAYLSGTTTLLNYLGATNTWAGGEAAVSTAAVAAGSSMGLYALSTGNGPGTLLGTFSLTDTAGAWSLSYTAIPEPSTYAVILGALTVGFVLLRRRFRPAGINALA